MAHIPSGLPHNKTSDDGIYLQAWVRACASPPRRWENSSTYRIWHHVLFEVGLRAGHGRGSPCPGNSRVCGSLDQGSVRSALCMADVGPGHGAVAVAWYYGVGAPFSEGSKILHLNPQG